MRIDRQNQLGSTQVKLFVICYTELGTVTFLLGLALSRCSRNHFLLFLIKLTFFGKAIVHFIFFPNRFPK